MGMGMRKIKVTPEGATKLRLIIERLIKDDFGEHYPGQIYSQKYLIRRLNEMIDYNEGDGNDRSDPSIKS